MVLMRRKRNDALGQNSQLLSSLMQLIDEINVNCRLPVGAARVPGTNYRTYPLYKREKAYVVGHSNLSQRNS